MRIYSSKKGWTAAAITTVLGVLALGLSSAQTPPVGGPPSMVALSLKGSVEGGLKVVNQICQGCHNLSGDSVAYPRLAAQMPSYLIIQLYNYKGPRQHPIMTNVAKGLSDQNIADVAAFYASLKPAAALTSSKPEMVATGAAIYNMGRAKDGLIACAVCHGAMGQGVNELVVPRIGHQTQDYLTDVLNEFKKGPDTPVPTYTAMKIVSTKLSNDDIAAVSEYLASMK